MKIIKKIIRETIKEIFLDESAKTFSDLSEDHIIIHTKGDIDNNGLILYDMLYDEIIGAIFLYKSYENYTVSTSYAMPGYGPLMYEIAMMRVNPYGLTPSREGTVNSKSANVWLNFYKRNDIKKIPINKKSKDWVDYFDGGFNSESTIKKLNTVFYKTPSSDFIKMFKKGIEALKSGKIDGDDIREKAKYLFNVNYLPENEKEDGILRRSLYIFYDEG